MGFNPLKWIFGWFSSDNGIVVTSPLRDKMKKIMNSLWKRARSAERGTDYARKSQQHAIKRENLKAKFEIKVVRNLEDMIELKAQQMQELRTIVQSANPDFIRIDYLVKNIIDIIERQKRKVSNLIRKLSKDDKRVAMSERISKLSGRVRGVMIKALNKEKTIAQSEGDEKVVQATTAFEKLENQEEMIETAQMKGQQQDRQIIASEVEKIMRYPVFLEEQEKFFKKFSRTIKNIIKRKRGYIVPEDRKVIVGYSERVNKEKRLADMVLNAEGKRMEILSQEERLVGQEEVVEKAEKKLEPALKPSK